MKIILGAFHVFPKFKNEVWNIAVSERGGLGDTVQELEMQTTFVIHIKPRTKSVVRWRVCLCFTRFDCR